MKPLPRLGLDACGAILPDVLWLPILQSRVFPSCLRALSLLTGLGLAVWPVWGQATVFRCGNEYTNDARLAQGRDCQALDLPAVTVLPAAQGTRRQAPPPPAVRMEGRSAGEGRPDSRIDAAQQRARDTDARAILEAELRKAETRLAQLQAEFKQGEPDKQGIEGRNHQRYLDRVQAMREELVRQQSDVASLRRELARLAPAALAATP